MAKRRPSLTLEQMERRLGYTADSVIDPHESAGRFYSDLRPVPRSAYEKTRRELEEHQRQNCTEGYGAISELEPDVAQTLSSGHDMIVLKRKSYIGYYSFTVNIHYAFGVNLPLQFTKDEASRTISVAKLKRNSIDGVASLFFRLPRDLRDRIYAFAIPEGEWRIGDSEKLNGVNFAGGIGDPSGFYFPLSKDLTILRVNGQMRQEALPFAYRRTAFCLDDMDDFIKLAISIGRIGRENIESLEFAWESRSDFECRWNETPDSENYCSKLPTLHALKCVQLLKQCKGLKFLRLYFESDLISNASLDDFKADPGIRELCSIRELDRVEIWSLECESLEHYGTVRWLKQKMKSSEKEGDKNGDRRRGGGAVK